MIKRAFDRLWNDKRGNVIAITAASLPLFIGAAGLATDTIQWTLWKRQLQRAADSAAIAGVYDRESAAAGATTRTAVAVTRDLAINLHTKMGLMTNYPAVTYPANNGALTNQVEVELRVQQSLPFSSMFLAAAPIIRATARAAALPTGGAACIHALESTSATGLLFSGTTDVNLPDCDTFSNSTGTNAALGKGNARVTAKSMGAVGGIAASKNFNIPKYLPNSPALPDPFRNVTPDPTDMRCGSSPAALTAGTSLTVGGTNCFSSLSVGSSESLTVPNNFGPIYIDAGLVNLQGDFKCTGCTIVMTNRDMTSAATFGSLTANSGTKINITAPTSGTYKGIAIYQDRRAPDCSKCHKLNGNSAATITGALYFPSAELVYNGGGSNNATCTMLVARRIEFSGNNQFKKLADCAAEGLPQGDTIRMVRLVA